MSRMTDARLVSIGKAVVQCTGAVYKYDLSLPPNDMYKLVEETRARMKHLPVTVVGYGHMGDSNLHLNISAGTILLRSICCQM